MSSCFLSSPLRPWTLWPVKPCLCCCFSYCSCSGSLPGMGLFPPCRLFCYSQSVSLSVSPSPLQLELNQMVREPGNRISRLDLSSEYSLSLSGCWAPLSVTAPFKGPTESSPYEFFDLYFYGILLLWGCSTLECEHCYSQLTGYGLLPSLALGPSALLFLF